MKIQQLYEREIDRRIDPAVVVSDMNDYNVHQEIDEYVFTSGITKNMYKFLNAVANKKVGKTGVWISGYYGSGKSHFIKYLFYCLNSQFGAKALDRFKESVKELDPLDEPTLNDATTLIRNIEKISFDEIIFNIDAVSKQEQDSKRRITEVLINQLNKFRGYNDTNASLALYVEKHLDEIGAFDKFKARIKQEFSEEWDGNQIQFLNMFLDRVIEIACEFDAKLDKQALRDSISGTQDFTIEYLISQIKGFLDEKDANYRLLFIMDEVSQYIGTDTNLLLNLQTIVEEVGSKIGTRVWLVCTAQQDLSNLISNTERRTEDFGKIMGRFETMISLESTDAAYITKRRVLDKNSSGIEELLGFYQSHKGDIENQFVFDHDLYQNFENRDDFTLTYPFIPYQFRLISDVFETFSNVGYVGEGVKNTERAILGITHFTAGLCKEKEVGYFVPFDLFFNDKLEMNLTHHARNIRDRAFHIEEVAKDPFGKRVVNALFMISNLSDSQSVNFPANAEHLALLLTDAVDTPKQEMQDKVRRVLDVLVKKNIIQESEGKYRFLKEDEIEVATLIKNTPVTSEDRLSRFYQDVIQKLVNPSPSVPFGNNNFKISIKVDDKEYGGRADFDLTFAVYTADDIEHRVHSVPSHDLVICINEALKHDAELKEKLLEYTRTQKYIQTHSANATGTRSKTIQAFKETNQLLLKEIHTRFERLFLNTPVISNNNIIDAKDLNGASVSARYKDMLERHMRETYRMHDMSNGYATSNAALITNAESKQKVLPGLSPAEEEVNNKIRLLGEGPSVADVIKQFEKDPYGWKDISTLDMLLQLGKKGNRRFEWRSEEIDLVTFVNKALNSRERDAINIYTEKAHSTEEVDAFKNAVNHTIFNENIISVSTTDFKDAIEAFQLALKKKLEKANELKEAHANQPFAAHLRKYHGALADIYQSRNNEVVFAEVTARQHELSKLRDTYMAVEEFVNDQLSNYSQIKTFARENKTNFDSLDETLQARAAELIAYFDDDSEPWETFPAKRQLYKELSAAIKARVDALQKDVLELFQGIFKEIEERRQSLKIDEAHLTTDAESFLKRIRQTKNIGELEVLEVTASSLKAENFKRLEDYHAKREAEKAGKKYKQSISVSLAAEMKPTTISTPEELDAYLEELRNKLMVKLGKNEKIFLN
jgi:hypothetical protein